MGISKKTCQTPNNNCNLTSRAHQKQLWCLLVLKMACVAHCSPCTLQLSHRVSVLNLSWCCQPHFALHSCSLMLVHGPPTLCLDGDGLYRLVLPPYSSEDWEDFLGQCTIPYFPYCLAHLLPSWGNQSWAVVSLIFSCENKETSCQC